MNHTPEIVELGYVSGVHGIRGWVKVFSYTDPREAILEYQPWLVGEDLEPVEIEQGRRHGKTVLARLPGVTTPESARSWVGSEIRARRDAMPAPESGHWYWHDLVGLRVQTTEGDDLGQVEKLMETGAHDVLVVAGDRERLIPFVRGVYVRRVDLEQGLIEVDWDPEF